jgi:Reverse transcriptase (RNA-dependent DNA polymerase)
MIAELCSNTSGDVTGEIMCYNAMFTDDKYEYDDPLHVYKAVSDPDTLYYHEAMREHDKDKFRESMLKEVTDQFENGNFTVIHKSQVPKGQVILPAVWQMRRKRDVMTGAIKKYKARLNIDGSRMRHGVHYDETYAPVASWNSVRMLLTLTVVHGWHTKQIDYVQAFAQAPVEKTLYMKIPAGVELEKGENTKDYVLKIHRNIYGQKQAGRVWNKYLANKLIHELGFKESKVDEFVFYNKGKHSMYYIPTTACLQVPIRRKLIK